MTTHKGQFANKTKLTTALARIAIALAGTTTSEIAYARGGGGGGGHQGMALMSQPVKTMPVHLAMGPSSRGMNLPTQSHSEKGERYDHKKHSGCRHIIVPTAGCGTPARDPVGNTVPKLPKEAKQPVGAGGKPVLEYAKAPVPQYSKPAPASATAPAANPGKVNITNGVTSSTLDPGKGLTVSSTGNGAISVSNGTNTVALAGGSLTLHGAPAVAAGMGVQVVRLSNGDYVVAANPSAAPTKSDVPPGVTIADDAKFVGHQLGNIAAAPVLGVVSIAGVPIAGAVGVIEGHPVKTIENFVDGVGGVAARIFE